MNSQIALLKAQEDKAWKFYKQSLDVTQHLQTQWRQLANQLAKLKFEERQKPCVALNEQEL